MRSKLSKILNSVIVVTTVCGVVAFTCSDAKKDEKAIDVGVVELAEDQKRNLNSFMNSLADQIYATNYLQIEYQQERGGVYENRKTSINMVDTMDLANEFQCELIEKEYNGSTFFKFGDKVISGIVMPGMDGTIVEDEWCEYMVPQGVTYYDGYFFITAYCSKDNHRSAIYVVDAETKEYVTTLIRNEISHSGGITIAGGYMWLCDGDYSLKYYDYKEVRNIIRDDLQSIDLSRVSQGTVEIDNRASYCTTYDEYICVGTFDETNGNSIHFYEPDTTVDKLIQVGKIGDLPVNTQGVLFHAVDDKEYMLITSSLGRWNLKKYYSRVYVYEMNESAFVELKKTFILPPMIEEPIIYEETVYFVFESCASSYKNWGASPVISKLCGFDSNYIFK